jgi:DNA modification methylase
MAVIEQEVNEKYAIYNGDCLEVVPTLPDNSIGFSVYSPPFAELYNYSSSDRDMSNCRNYEEFLTHYSFLVAQIARITKQGRLTAVHCMDLKKNSDVQRDFPGDIIRAHEAQGFEFFARITIWKEPLAVAIRTRQKSLMHKQIVKDSASCKPAGPDYVLVFRKPGKNLEPIEHPEGLTTYAGVTDPEKRKQLGYLPIPSKFEKYKKGWDDPKTNKWAHWIWQKYASPVWMDIRTGHVMPYKKAKEKEEEKHVCPLQLDVIERLITLYSNPGDVVLTPFLGVGSEAYQAVKMGRRAVGVELKPSYYRQAKINIAAAAESRVLDIEDDMFLGEDLNGDVDGDEHDTEPQEVDDIDNDNQEEEDE